MPKRAALLIDHLRLRRVGWDRGIFDHTGIRLNGPGLQVRDESGRTINLSREQFRFLSLLVAKTPYFVREDDAIKYVFGDNPEADKHDALKMVAYRLRHRLGPELARRVKRDKKRGWAYLSPTGHEPQRPIPV